MEVDRRHDALFRFVFGEPEQMGELLRSSLPASVAKAIDWGALRRVGGSFVDAELRERHADLLFEARLGGSPLLLFVLVEHKSDDYRFTALQLLRYVLRVQDAWLRANSRARALPVVLPFVVHHGKSPWRAPRSVRELVDFGRLPPKAVRFPRRLRPDLRFLLDDLAAGGEQRIQARRLSGVVDLCLRFLQVLRFLRPRDAGAAIDRWRHVVQRARAEARGREVLRTLWWWYLARFRAGEEAVRTIMAHIRDAATRQTMKSALDELVEEGFTKGLERGIEKGREESLGWQRELLRRQLTQRFGAVSVDLAARLTNASHPELETWSLRVLTAASIAEVFADG